MSSNKDVTFRYSRWKLIGFVLIGIIFLVGSFLILTGIVGDLELWSIDYILLSLALPLFAGLTLYNLIRLFQPSEVIKVNSKGIRDLRIGPTEIPWGKIHGLSIFEMKKHKFLMIELESEFEQQFEFTRTAKIKKSGNKNWGPKGHSIHMNGLNGSFDDLVTAIVRLAPATLSAAL